MADDAETNGQTNIIREALEDKETANFHHYLYQQRDNIQYIVAHHFRLSSKNGCVVSPKEEWKYGGFNTSIPVHIPSLQKRILVRCPMAHKLGESYYPGTVDEKSNGEVGVNLWMQQECTEIPIAPLHGFQFADGRHFTHSQYIFLPRRFLRYIRRCVCKYMKWPIPSWYVHTKCKVGLRTGYIILDLLDGESLSPALWSKYCNDTVRRRNLFRGIAEILLTFARTPLPRIGSWRFHNDGTISLSNRPLSCSLIIQENEGAKRVIQPSKTYSNVELYISDLLSYHYNWLMAEPNAVNNDNDCRAQLGAATILRAIFPHYFDHSSREGPFIMTPTDFNLNNLLVDEWGNVKHLVDLEFFCALPLQMCYQLRWLTGRPIDKITDHYLDEYNETQLQFLDILRELEAEHRKKEPSLIQFTKNMEIGWRTGRFWYSAAVMSVNASYNLFHHHIYKKFSSAPRTQKMYDHFSRFSSPKSTEVVAKKVADKVEYERQKALRRD